MYEQYLNKKYFYGKTDCGSICIEFLKNECNIIIQDVPRKNIFKDLNFCYNAWKNNNMYDINDINDVNDMNLKFGDIFIHNYNNLPIHCSVYIGNGQIISIIPYNYSYISNLSDECLKYPLKYHLRHKSLL